MWLHRPASRRTPEQIRRLRIRGYICIGLGLAFILYSYFMNLSGYALLVANNRLVPPFDHTVVLAQRSRLGALGVILNRPLTPEERAALPESSLRNGTTPLAYGGPVGYPKTIMLLAWRPKPEAPEDYEYKFVSGSQDFPADSATLDQRTAELKNENYQYRIFVGYAGWVSAQLEFELGIGRHWTMVNPADAGSLPALFDGSTADWAALHQRFNGE